MQAALKRFAFENRSNLQEIAECVFAGCDSLKSICLAAALEVIHGNSFSGSNLRAIEIGSGNPFFHVNGEFLVNSRTRCFVRYFGRGEEPRILHAIDSFETAARLRGVKFGPTCRLCSILA
jgi:hypothetical protein